MPKCGDVYGPEGLVAAMEEADANNVDDIIALGGGFGQAAITKGAAPTADIINTAFTRNRAVGEGGTAQGGGLYVEGEVNMVGGKVERNVADGLIRQGGGIYVNGLARMTITEVDIDDNKPDERFGPGAITFVGEPSC